MKIATFLLVVHVTTLACNSSAPTPEDLKAEVTSALDGLAAELTTERPADAGEYAERLRGYLDAHPAFYGSAVALLDPDGRIVASPYVYRTDDGYVTLDLAVPALQHRIAGMGNGTAGGQRRRLDGSLFRRRRG